MAVRSVLRFTATAREGTGVTTVIGTNGNQPTPPRELSPWRDGRATLRVRAATDADLLREAMTGLLEAAIALHVGEPDGRSVTIRGEGRDLVDLARGLFDSALDRIDTLQVAVVAVEIDGSVRSDDGVIAWGRLALGGGSPPRPRSIGVLAGHAEQAAGVTLVFDLAEDPS
jgi:hypothetical protein